MLNPLKKGSSGLFILHYSISLAHVTTSLLNTQSMKKKNHKPTIGEQTNRMPKMIKVPLWVNRLKRGHVITFVVKKNRQANHRRTDLLYAKEALFM